MSGSGDLASFAAFLTGSVVAIEEAQRHALETGAKAVAEEAKRVIGTYEYGWPSLAPATIARKSNGDTPLLETGALRESIGYRIINRHEAEVGASDPKARYQELGTSKIPPRPFLGGAAERKVPGLQETLGRGVVAALEKGR